MKGKIKYVEGILKRLQWNFKENKIYDLIEPKIAAMIYGDGPNKKIMSEKFYHVIDEDGEKIFLNAAAFYDIR